MKLRVEILLACVSKGASVGLPPCWQPLQQKHFILCGFTSAATIKAKSYGQGSYLGGGQLAVSSLIPADASRYLCTQGNGKLFMHLGNFLCRWKR